MSKETMELSDLKIVRDIMALLKLDDKGQLEKFFKGLIKEFTGCVKDLQFNLETTQREFKKKLEKLQEELEYAEVAVEEAYLDVTTTKFKTVEDKEAFKTSYLKGISQQEVKVTKLEQQISDAKEEQATEVKQIEEQIAKYEARIAKFSKLK